MDIQQLFAEGEVNIGEFVEGNIYMLFTEPEVNNCFSLITQVIIRGKQESSEKCRFCLFVSNCHASMDRDAQAADHMRRRNHMPNRTQSINCTCLKQYSLTAASLRRSIDFCE